ncbi:MAG TPA: tRNA preQ1(34) S-adenosylmethionine ribosyltransferase-isomerase QueA [bacterium]
MADRFEHYDFPLPEHLIAQHPLPSRDASRLMLLRRGSDAIAHHVFSELPALLPPDALLVLNNTRVPPRRLAARLPGGVAVEALLVAEEGPGLWHALVRKARRVKPGTSIPFADGRLAARAVERTADGGWRLQFEEPQTLPHRLEAHGLAPLPPYIRRDLHGAYDGAADRAAYQTCYARVDGAIAAPTAGLHFTPRVLAALRERAIETAELTLHVGLGTFAKVKVADPARHTMHAEWYAVPPDTAARVTQARAEGRPVIAVGTTTVRALESWAAAGAPPGGIQDRSALFIRPPFAFQAVDGMLTNFHMPRSTLLLLVSAFHGRERLLAAYREAVAQGYRFFSFGDCMLIAPDRG